MKNMSL